MGIWGKFFGGSSDTKGYRDKSDNSKVKVDRYKDTGGGKHTHDSYNQNTSSGKYKEYRGGENSSDRGYNKK